MKRAFLTIELMIAMGILIIVMAGVVLTSFGDQVFLAGSQTNSEAMIKAQEALEAQQAFARKDFNLANATSTNDGFYTSTVTVTNPVDAGTGKTDYLTKSVTADVSWKDEHGITRDLALTTLIANFTGVAGASTCNSSPEGNWAAPSTHPYSLLGLVPGLSGTYPITTLDAYQDRLYVGAGPTAASGDKKFFIFNLSSGVPSYINGSGLNTSGTTKPPNALVIATSTNGEVYAFLANGVSPDWSSPGSCHTASASCSQLEVIDVTHPETWSVTPPVLVYFKFATSTYSVPNTLPYVSGSGGQAVAKSIFYKNGYIFLGLSKTGNGGPEFHIIDVHKPLSPQSVGNFIVGAGVDSITVRGSFAYLATDDKSTGNALTILDISDPTSPKRIWSPLLSSSFGYGQSVVVVGDTLYFGMTYNSTNPEVFLYNNPTPSTAKPVQQPNPIDLGGTLGVSSMLVRDYLLLLLTSSNSLQIRNVRTGTQTSASLAGNGSAMDCEGNYLYVGSSDAGGGILEVTGS